MTTNFEFTHHFIVILRKSPFKEQPNLPLRFSNLLCAARTLTHYQYIGGEIIDILTNEKWDSVQATDILSRVNYG